MGVLEFIENNPTFFNSKLGMSEFATTSYKQVITHTRRVDSDLIDRQRPNESAEVKAYRAQNVRRFSNDILTKLFSYLGKTLEEANIHLQDSSDTLNAWLESKPFTLLGAQVDVFEYYYKYLIKHGMERANDAVLSFPYNSQDSTLPPTQLSANVRVGVQPLIVPFEKFVYIPTIDYNVFAWIGGRMKMQKGGIIDWYYIVDNKTYYTYKPTNVFRDKVRVYELEIWYFHDSGIDGTNILPVAFMAGILTNTPNGEEQYNESFIRGACEYFDEFMVRFSDNQVVNTRFSHPVKIVNGDIGCKTCSAKGQITTEKIINGLKQLTSSTCGSCNGSGRSNDSPAGTVYAENKGIEAASNRPLIEYLAADSNLLKLNKEDTFSFLKMGANALGVDLLIDTSESGEAMKMRMRPTAFFMESIAKGFLGQVMNSQLFFTECLLQSNRGVRKMPHVTLPKSYELETIDDKIETVNTTFAADKYNAMVEVIETKYKGNGRKIRVENLKLSYSPLWTLSSEEITERIALGIYERNDIIKRDYSSIAFDNLLKNNSIDIISLTDEQIITYVDNFIAPYLISNLGFEEGMEGELSNQDEGSKLLQTVGGAQAIVAVNQAVAAGEMSEAAAEEFLTLSFKISKEQANRLVESGAPKTEVVGKIV